MSVETVAKVKTNRILVDKVETTEVGSNWVQQGRKLFCLVEKVVTNQNLVEKIEKQQKDTDFWSRKSKHTKIWSRKLKKHQNLKNTKKIQIFGRESQNKPKFGRES